MSRQTTNDESVYLDGEFVSTDEASIPIDDPGYRWGYNVNDVFRTVDHEPYHLKEHVDRLFQSCTAARIDLDRSRSEVKSIAREVVDRHSFAHADDDVMVLMYVSGGWRLYPDPDEAYTPRLVISSARIPFRDDAYAYISGMRAVTARTRQIPAESINPNIKHRSRMHFVMADMEVKREDTTAGSLLLDTDGYVTEALNANFFIVTDGVVKTPPPTKVLKGVTRAKTLAYCEDRGIPAEETDLTLYDVYNADEAFYTNTSHMMIPVTEVDDVTIGSGRPGPVSEALLEAHSTEMGRDVVEQFFMHLPEGDRPDQMRLGGDRGIE